MRKKSYFAVFLCICLLFGLTACSREGENRPASVSALSRSENRTGAQTEETAGASRTLIAYFTWADNTEIQDEEAALDSALAHYESVGDSSSSNADAVTSASLLAPGNAARIAQWIQERTGGDLFSIQVEEPYPDNYDDCLDRAADEKADNARPALAEEVENMEQYDTVFIGYPNWWYTCPMAIFSFIEENDLSGKNIVLFCTHGTGGLAGSVEDIVKALPDDCTVVDNVLGVYRAEVTEAETAVETWLEEIGYGKKEETTMTESRRIRLSFGGGEMLVNLADNSAADDLLARLPLTLSFEDFNGTEKISYLESELDLSDAPDACTPKAGDLTYYAPWGNLAFFYRDFRQSPQLVPLGSVESGAEYLETLDTHSQVVIERYEEKGGNEQ